MSIEEIHEDAVAPRSARETFLAGFSIVAATIHFTGETACQIRLGQSLPMRIVDSIAVGLTPYAASRSLASRPDRSGARLLAGAWAITSCLSSMTFFGRSRIHGEGLDAIDREPDAVLPVLGLLLLVSGTAFAGSFALAHPRR